MALRPPDLPRETGFATPVMVESTRLVEAVMIAEGCRIRIGPRAEDLIPIEHIALGDALWDCALSRMVDIATIACGTFGPRELSDQGLRALNLPDGGTIAIASSRLGQDRTPPPQTDPQVFLRLWPESRCVVQIDESYVTIRQ